MIAKLGRPARLCNLVTLFERGAALTSAAKTRNADNRQTGAISDAFCPNRCRRNNVKIFRGYWKIEYHYISRIENKYCYSNYDSQHVIFASMQP